MVGYALCILPIAVVGARDSDIEFVREQAAFMVGTFLVLKKWNTIKLLSVESWKAAKQTSYFFLLCFIHNFFHGPVNVLDNRFLINVGVRF